jgi:hypothetical protein
MKVICKSNEGKYNSLSGVKSFYISFDAANSRSGVIYIKNKRM